MVYLVLLTLLMGGGCYRVTAHHLEHFRTPWSVYNRLSDPVPAPENRSVADMEFHGYQANYWRPWSETWESPVPARVVETRVDVRTVDEVPTEAGPAQEAHVPAIVEPTLPTPEAEFDDSTDGPPVDLVPVPTEPVPADPVPSQSDKTAPEATNPDSTTLELPDARGLLHSRTKPSASEPSAGVTFRPFGAEPARLPVGSSQSPMATITLLSTEIPADSVGETVSLTFIVPEPRLRKSTANRAVANRAADSTDEPQPLSSADESSQSANRERHSLAEAIESIRPRR